GERSRDRETEGQRSHTFAGHDGGRPRRPPSIAPGSLAGRSGGRRRASSSLPSVGGSGPSRDTADGRKKLSGHRRVGGQIVEKSVELARHAGQLGRGNTPARHVN